MKLRLSIILLAAALAAAPAAGQTVKSLGYNTTNGQVVYSGTNTLRMPDQVKFGTNSAGIASGSQYLTLLDGGGGVALQLGTNRIIAYDEIDFGGISGTALSNAATTRTNFGLGGTNTVTFSNLQLNSFSSGGSGGFVGRNGTQLALYGTNVSSSVPAFYGWDGFNNAALSAGTSRTNLGLGATNNVTFSNITASGTLAVTGNVTLSGVNNTATAQTASSGSSLMTRTLTDNNPLWTAGSIRLLAAYASDSANGGAVTLNSYGLGSATVSGGTNTNGYGRANLADGINTARQYLGGGVNFTQNISASFVATIRSQLVGDSVIRFVVGAPAGGVPPPAQSNAITIRGFGVEFSPGAGPAAFDGTTNARARLFAHNGTNYSTSAYTADFPSFFISSQSQAQFIVSSSTNGVVTLHMNATDGLKSAGRPSTTAVLTLSNGPTDGTGGPFVSLFSVNSSTNAPALRPEMVIYNGFIEVKN